MRNIYYWCPFIGNVATVKAVINSAYSLSKYSNKIFNPTIINSCGEWDNFRDEINQKNINLKVFKNFFKININTSGFVKSRLTYLAVFFSCFFSLKNLLKKERPEFLIAHLITSLPIFLYILFNFRTKLIIRISGKIKLGFLRKILWRLCRNKINTITCPTKETQQEFIKLNLIDRNKVIYLPDPIIDISEIIKLKNTHSENLELNKNFFLLIGRFTKQKNHILGIKSFAKILKNNSNLFLFIIGNGEYKKKYKAEIDILNVNENIKLLDYEKNIPYYLSRSLGLISTSLWEDPGFVMVEAAACNTFIISSNCPSGPQEFIGNKNGLLFENNSSNDLEKKISKFLKMKKNDIEKMKIGAKKNSMIFTKFRHYQILKRFLI